MSSCQFPNTGRGTLVPPFPRKRLCKNPIFVFPAKAGIQSNTQTRKGFPQAVLRTVQKRIYHNQRITITKFSIFNFQFSIKCVVLFALVMIPESSTRDWGIVATAFGGGGHVRNVHNALPPLSRWFLKCLKS